MGFFPALSSRNRNVWEFAIRVLAWLGPAFGEWYLLSAAHARPVGWLAQDLVNALSRGIVKALEWKSHVVTMVTDLAIVSEGREGVLTHDLNPLIYTYGSALFLALALASRLRFSRILIGLAILIPFHAWGLAFEMLAEIGVKASPQIAASAGIVGFKRELVPLGYQLGSLIFPTLVPVLLWAMMGGLREVIPEAFPAKPDAS